MTNPFEDRRELSTGFYFDKKLKTLVYLYKDAVKDSPYSKIYNRFGSNTDMSLVFSNKNHLISKIENLSKLSVDILGLSPDIKVDFNWISSSDSIKQTFTNFLIEEELYLILSLFKTYSDGRTR